VEILGKKTSDFHPFGVYDNSVAFMEEDLGPQCRRRLNVCTFPPVTCDEAAAMSPVLEATAGRFLGSQPAS
jgi:hypothetical protein